ncbi:hypothetical protein GGR21_000553 [Dysgonomonas hofstadii]|uniref:DUF2752 domain-containing protein n=1 Tax=Dysgonomonas hofstadii TaxID=637886 RepID=A0A840CHB6_9BACT|nr:DUF2752 domain-containing protein [Dysgonomonas hofstadii]MBB4034666.1 hypothetical protein [Dysgonomonas hofstadii]
MGGILFYLFSPEESGFFPVCPFHYLTGYDCPGCGSQRALHHLSHLHLREAFLSNPLLIIAIPFLISGIYLEYFGGKERHPEIRKALYSKRAVYIILAIIILFWIGRNVG